MVYEAAMIRAMMPEMETSLATKSMTMPAVSATNCPPITAR